MTLCSNLMSTEKEKCLLFAVLVLVVTVLITCAVLQADNLISIIGGKPAEPSLRFACPDVNDADASIEYLEIEEPNQANLVVVTHGWFEDKPWAKELAFAIAGKVDSKQWLCGWFDWRARAKEINPTDAAEYGRDVAGPMLAERILRLSKDFKHIHLIGHSAGSWVISEAAKVIAKETKANIHLTFLDAYVPPFWDEKELGDFTNEPNLICWAEHYYTRDITLKFTDINLSHAHNVDLTKVTPGVNDHEFPRYWYHATVIGKYAPRRRYHGKKLFWRTEDTEYGFARSLEAGEQNWQASLKSAIGNEAVKIERTKKPLGQRLKGLFKKDSK